ncbi:MAG: hypothetical protein NTV33_11355 [Coprothermobacterota bacterium]|nr:hypothetical protein [Coprothermobacterota bacterium]
MKSGLRLRNVLWKEWRGLLTSASSLLMVTLIPVVIVAQILFVIFLVSRLVSPDVLAASPLLLIPMMVANMLSTFSIIEEKQTRTLEPLLATPVRTGELLLGKALAGALPAVLMTWVSAALCLAGIAVIGPSSLLGFTLTPSWLVSLLLLAPLVTLLSFLLGVIGSSRAADSKGAQNFALVEVLPLLALVAAQVLGVLPLSPWALLAVSAGFALLDFLFLRLAVSLFRRESILVSWR